MMDNKSAKVVKKRLNGSAISAAAMYVALGLVAIMVVIMTSACTLTDKAAGESLKTNDIPDGEAASGQAVSEKKRLFGAGITGRSSFS